VPLRPRLLLACEAEVAHARAQFWRLAHELRLADAFDRYLDPDCHAGAMLDHERAAATVLNCLSHLQTEEWLIGESLAQGLLRSDRAYMRKLFARRCMLKQVFRDACAAYRAARTEIDRVKAAA
jgi:hypothetical protein